MERATTRAVRAGYRSDWRGLLAYLNTPEAWTTPAHTVFVMAVGGLVAAIMASAVTKGSPPLSVPVNALGCYWFLVRPVLRIAERRAASTDSNGPNQGD